MRFHYLAVTAANDRRTGLIEAENSERALELLQRDGLVVVKLRTASILFSIWRGLNRDIIVRPPISRHSLAGLSQEWAGLVSAGISIEESLGFLISTSRPSTQRILLQVRDAIKGGASLHEALSQHPTCFPATYRMLIQAGEAAGALGETFQRLSDEMIAQRSIKEELRNALIYPVFLLTTAIVGISTLLVVVVPNLENLFGSRSYDTLPLITRTVIQTSHLVRDSGYLIPVACILLTLAVAGTFQTTAGRTLIDLVILKTPIIGPLVQALETSRFTRSLGALLSGGVPVARALPLATKTVSNLLICTALQKAHTQVVAGAPIGDAIAAGDILPDDVIGLIRMGERTGHLDKALERAASLYEGRVSRKLKALTTVLTPVLTVGFGLIAGVIIYAMLSTILSINDLAG